MDYKEKLKAIINSNKTPFVDIDTFLKYFPELAESEDERTRKSIIELLNEVHFTFKYYDINKMLAWLEKQGQVKEPTISQYEEDERIRETIIKILLCFDHYEGITGKDMIAWVKNQGEQNPAEWSEKDREYMQSLLDIINGTSSLTPSEVECHKDWLKSLKDRVQPQFTWKPSEEQMTALRRVKNAVGGEGEIYGPLNSLYEDLKKLKD